MHCRLILLLLLQSVNGFLESGFRTNPSLSTRKSFHYDTAVFALKKCNDGNTANAPIVTQSTISRRAFFLNVPLATVAAATVFLPNEQANADEGTRDLFRPPEMVAARKAKEQAIIDEKKKTRAGNN